MKRKQVVCECGNPYFGFDCTCEHEKNNPGDDEFSCEFCGYFIASKPICNKCERLTDNEK